MSGMVGMATGLAAISSGGRRVGEGDGNHPSRVGREGEPRSRGLSSLPSPFPFLLLPAFILLMGKQNEKR